MKRSHDRKFTMHLSGDASEPFWTTLTIVGPLPPALYEKMVSLAMDMKKLAVEYDEQCAAEANNPPEAPIKDENNG